MTRFGNAAGVKGAAAAALAVLAVPAVADVRAGVEAWSNGEYAAAVREWEQPAASGDADALFNLGQAYRLGQGVKADAARAEQLYARAAAKGHLQAADIYGLMLFQEGRRSEALPYIQNAARRGDPRAQYVLGVSYFNGDGVPLDWPRAYALMTLSHRAGLPQAATAIAEMDESIPLAQRQAAAALATELAQQAQLATPDNASGTAGAGPVSAAVGSGAPAATEPAPQQASGPWRVQLGAFAVAGNADRLWRRIRPRAELAGRRKIIVPSGRVVRLLAGGYASRAEADAACRSLRGAGQDCLVTRD